MDSANDLFGGIDRIGTSTPARFLHRDVEEKDMRRILQCPCCGQTFETYIKQQKYCSEHCQNRDYYLKNRKELLERRKLYRITGKWSPKILQCPCCGQTFETYIKQQKYCSEHCRNRDYYLKNRKEYLERMKIYRITGKWPPKKKR